MEKKNAVLHLCRKFWQKKKTFCLNVGDGWKEIDIQIIQAKMFVWTREGNFQGPNQKISPAGRIISTHYPNMVKYI